MEKTARTKRIAAGICCLLAGALVAGWAIGKYLPAAPREASPERSETSWEFISYSTVEAENVVDVPLGAPYLLENLLQEEKHFTDFGELDEGERALARHKAKQPDWSYECSALSMKVGSAKAVSLQAFSEWYPHYAEVYSGFVKAADGVVILVDITLANKADADTRMPSFSLWTEGIDGSSVDVIGSGWQVDRGILAELYGEPRGGSFKSYQLKDRWNMLAPGEEKSCTIPFVVSRGALGTTDQAPAYDLSQFCIATWDCESATAYRFWLG